MTKLAPVMLDTDILSLVMRKNPIVLDNAQSYLNDYSRFTFSIITKYEIYRGLLAKEAIKQQELFDKLCSTSRIIPLSDSTIIEAAKIYSDLYRRGELVGDADILIAATAITHDLVIVTNNESHFRRITNLQVENWCS